MFHQAPIDCKGLLELAKRAPELIQDPEFHANLIVGNVCLYAISGQTFFIDDIARPEEDDALTMKIIDHLLELLPDAGIYVLAAPRTGHARIVVDWSM